MGVCEFVRGHELGGIAEDLRSRFVSLSITACKKNSRILPVQRLAGMPDEANVPSRCAPTLQGGRADNCCFHLRVFLQQRIALHSCWHEHLRAHTLIGKISGRTPIVIPEAEAVQYALYHSAAIPCASDLCLHRVRHARRNNLDFWPLCSHLRQIFLAQKHRTAWVSSPVWYLNIDAKVWQSVQVRFICKDVCGRKAQRKYCNGAATQLIHQFDRRL
mmetsp:Transcript_121482/g.329962  ORF Transcript_121482/g.329962 Transcript_121482/m.329962 type:complete len:217 (+) Transcript_121482:486-1136(+)